MDDYYVCTHCGAVFHDAWRHTGMHRCPNGHLTEADRFEGTYEEARDAILSR